jgi:two-component system sensor histidine kinase VicK
MARLVRDLLQLSRLEYKQEEMHKQDINLTEILESAVTKVWLQAQGKKQQMNRLFDPGGVATVYADKDQLEQVLLNVLSNAIKYTEPGGRIDIDLRLEGSQVNTTIKDNGVGIPEEDVSRVFERFFRVDKARSRAMGGTGLGLAISKQIVENHEGKILLDSKEGKGTTVTLQFPLVSHRGQRNID